MQPATGSSLLIRMGERYDAIVEMADGVFPTGRRRRGKGWSSLRADPHPQRHTATSHRAPGGAGGAAPGHRRPVWVWTARPGWCDCCSILDSGRRSCVMICRIRL
ncbi:hypothetical protein [Nocardia brasiliensis]|uniref:hypothetical protein n=1 Tax=Nocardia brasiliensis TaxID=37326 RepID=UPI00351D6671